MTRVFLVVMDSVGIGGAPDADAFFNSGVPDTGANTVLHIAQACAEGKADQGRAGPLHVPHLCKMGLGAAVALSDRAAPGLSQAASCVWSVARETSRGKDTPSGHWEIAGLPVDWDWTYFPDPVNSFPQEIIQQVCDIAGVDGVLGNCHAPGTEIIDRLAGEHIKTGRPICYTSADSVFQIAAHEDHFGLDRLYDLCARLAPSLHAQKVGRVIARPFLGEPDIGYTRTVNRKDYAMTPPKPILMNWLQEQGHPVYSIGKIGDIFANQGIDHFVKGSDQDLADALMSHIETCPDGAFVFANFVEFDSVYGHRRDIAGYARALEWFDGVIAKVCDTLRDDDVLIITADHGNDPSWVGTDHTREQVPVLTNVPLNQTTHSSGRIVKFSDIAVTIAHLFGISSAQNGDRFL